MAKVEENIGINGTRYKRVTKVVSGTDIWQKDIPLVPSGVHASGLHIIFQNPQNNHYDHINCGSEWKKYITQGN